MFTAAFFAAAGVTTGFLPLWMSDRGVDAGRVGTVLGVASLIRLGAVPVWGALADRVGRPRPMLLAAASATALSFICLSLVNGFLPMMAFVTVGGIAAAALTPLADALTVALAGAGRLVYARTRAWGSVAYMLSTAGVGPLLGLAGTRLVPMLIAAGYAAAALLAPFVPEPARLPHLSRSTGGLIGLPALRVTIAASALIQGSHAAYYGFAAISWRAAGLSDAAIGLLIAEGVIMEIVLFVWGGAWATRLGPARLTACAAFACALRWTVLATTAAWPVLVLVQLLHAMTFAMQHLSSMYMLGRCIPPGRAAGAQTLHSALGFSAPTGILIWLVGLGYGTWGSLVFLPMALLGAGGLLLVRPIGRIYAAAA